MAAPRVGGGGLNFSGEAGHKNRVNRALDNRRKARAMQSTRKANLAAILSNEISS